MRLARIASASVFVSAVVVGCGSGSSTPDGGGFPDVHPADTGVDASADASGDVIVPGEGSPEDAPIGDGGCAGVAKSDCLMCCAKAEPKGKKAMELAELGCACKPDLCGARGEAGKGTGMGLGEGACVAECKDHKTAATKDCITCLDDAKGTKAKPGMCYTDVNTKCAMESGCMEYQACVASCT
jgi:hypothetical protein